jgi:quercetin dioxygenase-like cupin family protein
MTQPATGVIPHVADDALPWIPAGDGVELKLLRVVESAGLWIVRNRFQPGVQIPTHRHTGPIHGFTLTGRWHYAEYKIDYTAGSYIFEPANSVHTLSVNADNTEATDVLFVMEGANLNLSETGEIERVDDGPTTLAYYRAACEAQGLPEPPVLTV